MSDIRHTERQNGNEWRIHINSTECKTKKNDRVRSVKMSELDRLGQNKCQIECHVKKNNMYIIRQDVLQLVGITERYLFYSETTHHSSLQHSPWHLIAGATATWQLAINKRLPEDGPAFHHEIRQRKSL